MMAATALGILVAYDVDEDEDEEEEVDGSAPTPATETRLDSRLWMRPSNVEARDTESASGASGGVGDMRKSCAADHGLEKTWPRYETGRGDEIPRGR